MCFEFEWLYWAQLAQEQEQQRRDARQEATRSSGPAQEDQRVPQPSAQEPAHA